MMVVKRRGGEGRGWHVSEEKGDEKRKQRLIHLSALCYSFKLLLFDRSDQIEVIEFVLTFIIKPLYFAVSV